MKRFLWLFPILLAFIFLTGFAGIGDAPHWYYDLPNGYQIAKTNSEDISIDSPYATLDISRRTDVRPRVVAFFVSEDERFVAAEQETLTNGGSYLSDDLQSPPPSIIYYYIIDTQHHERYGPYTQTTFAAKANEVGLGEIDWISSTSVPPGAEYYGNSNDDSSFAILTAILFFLPIILLILIAVIVFMLTKKGNADT